MPTTRLPLLGEDYRIPWRTALGMPANANMANAQAAAAPVNPDVITYEQNGQVKRWQPTPAPAWNVVGDNGQPVAKPVPLLPRLSDIPLRPKAAAQPAAVQPYNPDEFGQFMGFYNSEVKAGRSGKAIIDRAISQGRITAQMLPPGMREQYETNSLPVGSFQEKIDYATKVQQWKMDAARALQHPDLQTQQEAQQFIMGFNLDEMLPTDSPVLPALKQIQKAVTQDSRQAPEARKQFVDLLGANVKSLESHQQQRQGQAEAAQRGEQVKIDAEQRKQKVDALKGKVAYYGTLITELLHERQVMKEAGNKSRMAEIDNEIKGLRTRRTAAAAEAGMADLEQPGTEQGGSGTGASASPASPATAGVGAAATVPPQQAMGFPAATAVQPEASVTLPPVAATPPATPAAAPVPSAPPAPAPQPAPTPAPVPARKTAADYQRETINEQMRVVNEQIPRLKQEADAASAAYDPWKHEEDSPQGRKYYEARARLSQAYDRARQLSKDHERWFETRDQVTEGRTAVNPSTGQRIVFQNGKWVPIQ